MRSMFSVVSVLFVGLIGCRAAGDSPPAAAGIDKIVNNTGQIANHTDLADNTGKDDPTQICPDICGPGTPCEMPDGSCTLVCNSCYCTREDGTVVDKCHKASAAQRSIQATGFQVAASGDGDGSR